MPSTLKVAGVVGDSITDGPGLRTTIFLQGCPHECPECHNPETWDTGGGSYMSVEQLIEAIKKNPISTGVTLSGGEPFCQSVGLLPLAEWIKAQGLELAIYTGYLYEELPRLGVHATALRDMADTVVDGPYLAEQRDLLLKFRGSKNQRIIDVRRSSDQGITVEDHSPRWN